MSLQGLGLDLQDDEPCGCCSVKSSKGSAAEEEEDLVLKTVVNIVLEMRRREGRSMTAVELILQKFCPKSEGGGAGVEVGLSLLWLLLSCCCGDNPRTVIRAGNYNPSTW